MCKLVVASSLTDGLEVVFEGSDVDSEIVNCTKKRPERCLQRAGCSNLLQ